VDWADRDEEDNSHPTLGAEEKEDERNRATRNLYSFPRGTRAGIFFHDLLENFDFTEQSPAALKDLVESKLQEHNLDREWGESVVQMLDRVVSVTLRIGEEEFSLSQISPQQRLNELAFYYPLKRATRQDIFHLMSPGEGRAKQRQFPETLGKAFFSPFKGYMKGYMDLVFEHGGRYFIVDWKSNYLGNRIEDYGPEALAWAMDKGYYGLQCRIYALALHQYLKQRVSGYHYDSHFGGVFYIFLRGLDPIRGQAYGIYRERPPEEQIQKWVTDLIL
jgi:exodeoxyribonuclease V beta subunit